MLASVLSIYIAPPEVTSLPPCEIKLPLSITERSVVFVILWYVFELSYCAVICADSLSAPTSVWLPFVSFCHLKYSTPPPVPNSVFVSFSS